MRPRYLIGLIVAVAAGVVVWQFGGAESAPASSRGTAVAAADSEPVAPSGQDSTHLELPRDNDRVALPDAGSSETPP